MAEIQVVGIYTAADKGEPMEDHDFVSVVAGKGIEGDRYAEGRGRYSNTPKQVRRDITLINAEAIEIANTELDGPGFRWRDTRRNIIVEGGEGDVVDFVDREFTVGSVVCRGVEPCIPCKVPSRLAGIEGFMEAFEGRGGLRAEVLESGIIAVSDTLEVVENQL